MFSEYYHHYALLKMNANHLQISCNKYITAMNKVSQPKGCKTEIKVVRIEGNTEILDVLIEGVKVREIKRTVKNW